MAPRLHFFRTSVLVLARSCDKLAATKSANTQFHKNSAIALWALFPSFCASPSDIQSEVESIADTLCRAMGDKRYPELITSICNGLVVLVKSWEEKGGPELDDHRDEKEALGRAAKKLLPNLFKLITDAHAALVESKADLMDIDKESFGTNTTGERFQKLHAVCDAISMTARVSSRPFLEGLFKTVMQRILTEFQSDSGDKERVCALLTLSQALVSSQVLFTESLDFLYRALKPLLRDNETPPRVQKRAYKVLLELCEKHPCFISADGRTKELANLLTGTIMSSQISARYMRLKCICSIVHGAGRNEENESVSEWTNFLN